MVRPTSHISSAQKAHVARGYQTEHRSNPLHDRETPNSWIPAICYGLLY